MPHNEFLLEVARRRRKIVFWKPPAERSVEDSTLHAEETTRSARLSRYRRHRNTVSSFPARPPPPLWVFGCGRSPTYPLLVTGMRLAHTPW